MYLHIGNGKNIPKKDIVGIFDMDTATVSSVSRRFIRKKETLKKIEYDDSDIPRSFVLSSKKEKSSLKGKERLINKKNEIKKSDSYIHLSKISTSALKVRVESESYYDYDVTEEN